MVQKRLLKDNREKPKHKIELSIESANNGWLLRENLFNNEIFSSTLEELIAQARKILLLFGNKMFELEKFKEVPLIEKFGRIEKTANKKQNEEFRKAREELKKEGKNPDLSELRKIIEERKKQMPLIEQEDEEEEEEREVEEDLKPKLRVVSEEDKKRLKRWEAN